MGADWSSAPVLRLALALAALLLPGCIFSDFDANCPKKLMVITVEASQDLVGPWETARAWRSLNNTTAWSFAPEEGVVLGNFSRDPGGVGILIFAAAGETGSHRLANATMIFDWPRCVKSDEYDATLAREHDRHVDEWSTWRQRFSNETDMEPRSEAAWRFKLCCDPNNDWILGPTLPST